VLRSGERAPPGRRYTLETSRACVQGLHC